MNRLKCISPIRSNCNRILTSDKTSVACSSCGHGTLKVQEPKNYCDTCQRPIYDNVSTSGRVTCASCTMNKVDSIRNCEKTLGTEFLSTKDLANKTSKPCHTPAEIDLPDRLKDSREALGMTTKQMAMALCISQARLKGYELGTKPRRKALQRILAWLNKDKATGEKHHFQKCA